MEWFGNCEQRISDTDGGTPLTVMVETAIPTTSCSRSEMTTLQSAGSALEASVSGNAISVTADYSQSDSEMSLGTGGGFRDLAGVSAVAMASGANSSQNVSVNVSAGIVSY